MKNTTTEEAKLCLNMLLGGLAVFALFSILLLPLMLDYLIYVWTHYLLMYFLAALAFSFAFAFFACYYNGVGVRMKKKP